jgi:hypothetical protein
MKTERVYKDENSDLSIKCNWWAVIIECDCMKIIVDLGKSSFSGEGSLAGMNWEENVETENVSNSFKNMKSFKRIHC